MPNTDVVKPTFLIIGSAKAGTTSLYEYLRQHPECFMPEQHKELTFFAPPDAQWVKTEAQYFEFLEPGRGKKAVGEASVTYLFAPESPALIKTALGSDVRLIVLLRNPVDMVYSLWAHQCKSAGEDLSFEEALKAETVRMLDPCWRPVIGWKYNSAYKDRATYMPQIGRYDALFPPENIRIYLFEEFFSPGLPMFSDLCRFLDIDPSYQPEAKIFNRAGGVRSRTLLKVVNAQARWKEPLKKIVPFELRQRLKAQANRINTYEGALPPMSGAMRAKLEDYFASDVLALEGRLGRSLEKIWF